MESNDKKDKASINEATGNIEEKKGENIHSTNIAETFSPFERAIADLLVWYQNKDGTGAWRVRKEYRDLFACLTPRQIKSFLRERLLAADAAAGDDPPAVLFLQTLFHPLWKVRRDEPELFHTLIAAAEGAIKLSNHKTKAAGKLSGPALDFFYSLLQAATGESSVLSEKEVRACWPRKSGERALLVHLLAVSGLEKSKTGESMKTTNRSRTTPDFAVSRTTPDFAVWVREKLGQRPRGFSITEQVSSFQDIVLAKYNSGDKRAQKTVEEYEKTFLSRHKQFFDASIASSLSNLAAMISIFSGSEASCDRLYRAALELADQSMKPRITGYYVEFLLDVLGDPARMGRLISDQYETKETLIEYAQGILDPEKRKDLDPKTRFYYDTLHSRLSLLDNQDKQVGMGAVWKLTKGNAAVLLEGEPEPSSRLNDLLDAVIGKHGDFLTIKEPLQGLVWAAMLKAKKPGWPMAIQIANDLVGESSANSAEEQAGLGMNAALVCDQALLNAHQEERLAAIWSQVGALFSRRIGKTAPNRIACAFLASMIYGGNAQSIDRMQMAAEILGGTAEDGLNPEFWNSKIESEQEPLVTALANKPNDPKAARQLADEVFGGEYQRIDTPQDLAKRLKWDTQRFEWADNKTFNEAVDDLLAAAGIKPGESDERKE